MQTTVSMIGSNASSRPYTSLSCIQPSTPTSGENANASPTESAVACAPCGLCAASSTIVGLRRTTSSRPGELTAANARRTRSASTCFSSFAPTKASTAASAVTALRAWCSPCNGTNTSSYSPASPRSVSS